MPTTVEPACTFSRSWIGPCGEPALLNGMCLKHAAMRCKGCGKPATKDCEHTGIQFVCGAPLCDGCSHAPPKPGELNFLLLGGDHKASEEATREWLAVWDSEEQALKKRHEGGT